jgi:hypothetical protein
MQRRNDMATTYAAPGYDEKKYRKGIDTSFYNNAITNYTQQAEKQRATQLGEAQKTQQSALKQAYINRVQNQNKLNDSLTRSGIRGGATETSNLNIMNQYGNARAAANADYSNSVNQINQNVDQNIMDYTNDMNSRAEEYRQNTSQARWQADREDSLNQYNSAVEYWNNYYLDYYSGSSKKDLKKALKKAEANLKKAKTQAEKIRITQQIRGIQNRRGVIANSK